MYYQFTVHLYSIIFPDAIDCANAKRYKVSCPAHITIRRILRFPDHELVEDSFPGVAALRKAKKQVSFHYNRADGYDTLQII